MRRRRGSCVCPNGASAGGAVVAKVKMKPADGGLQPCRWRAKHETQRPQRGAHYRARPSENEASAAGRGSGRVRLLRLLRRWGFQTACFNSRHAAGIMRPIFNKGRLKPLPNIVCAQDWAKVLFGKTTVPPVGFPAFPAYGNPASRLEPRFGLATAFPTEAVFQTACFTESLC